MTGITLAIFTLDVHFLVPFFPLKMKKISTINILQFMNFRIFVLDSTRIRSYEYTDTFSFVRVDTVWIRRKIHVYLIQYNNIISHEMFLNSLEDSLKRAFEGENFTCFVTYI